MKINSEFGDEQFLGIIFSLWKNKFKIILLPFLFLIASFIYSNNSVQKKEFTVYTLIKPLTYLEENQYLPLNEVSKIISNNPGGNSPMAMTFTITRDSLFQLFVDTLNNKSTINKIFNEIQLEENITQTDKNKLNSKIHEIRSSLRFYNDDIKNKYNLNKGKIKFVFNKIEGEDEVKSIEEILLIFEKKINYEIKEILTSKFNSYILSLQEINNYFSELKNEDLIKSQQKKIEYLKSHAVTARDLGIDKISENITEVLLTYDKINFMFTYSNPFYYLMGYEFIEKRIAQINDGLDQLTTNNTDLLDNNKDYYNLFNIKSVNGIKKLMNKTSLGKSEGFFAANFDLETSEFHLTSTKLHGKKLMFFAFITGLLFSIIYFLIHEKITKKYKKLITAYKKS